MKPFIPEKIIIQKKVLNTEVAQNILSYFSKKKNIDPSLNALDDRREILDDREGAQSDKDKNGNDIHVELIDNPQEIGLKTSIETGKKHLLVQEYKGEVFEHCPAGKPGMMCCNYFIFPFAQNCHMDCEYCFLQYYLNKQAMVVYANIEELLQKVKTVLEKRTSSSSLMGRVRIGTGEYADSLALDHITGISRLLVPFFSQMDSAILELKTKTNNIENLMHMDPGSSTVVSWSLSPEEIVQNHEHGTSSLEERILAAKQCLEKGYKIGFHFDPIVYYENWEKGYQDVIELMASKIDFKKIEWISLGNLRLTRELKTIMKLRWQKSPLASQEMVRSLDGRFRYPKKIRIEMYQKIWGWILEKRNDQPLYLCMENPNMWREVTTSKNLINKVPHLESPLGILRTFA